MSGVPMKALGCRTYSSVELLTNNSTKWLVVGRGWRWASVEQKIVIVQSLSDRWEFFGHGTKIPPPLDWTLYQNINEYRRKARRDNTAKHATLQGCARLYQPTVPVQPTSRARREFSEFFTI
eukprot:scaffold23485_cov37-Cyclotella_meneghiniana.AAC.3